MPAFTKRLLILSDGKAGHVKQSQSIAGQIQALKTPSSGSERVILEQTVLVSFKSVFHRGLFPWFCFFFMPFARGSLRFLRFFFKEDTAKAIEAARPDIIISAGSRLAPLNLRLTQNFGAKSLVLMRPSFPFHAFHYDLAVIPAHDRGGVPKGALRVLLAPSTMKPEALERGANPFMKQLREPSRIRYAVFLGGDTRSYKMNPEDIRKVFEVLNRLCSGKDYLVTTSRRTSDAVVRYLEKEIRPHPACQLLVNAKKDTRPEVVGGMMFLAEILIVTEDSISMISEAVRCGKRVIVLCFEGKGLPGKHRRFRDALVRESAVVTATARTLEEKILNSENQPAVSVLQSETEALNKRLQALV